MIDEDAVTDAECMKAVALGGGVFLLCRSRAYLEFVHLLATARASPAVKTETGRPVEGRFTVHSSRERLSLTDCAVGAGATTG